MELFSSVFWLFILGKNAEASSDVNFGDVREKLDRQFLGEEASTPGKSKGQARSGIFSGVFCDEQDPLCQKFQGALPGQPGSTVVDGGKETRFQRSMDDSQVSEQKDKGETDKDPPEVDTQEEKVYKDIEPLELDYGGNDEIFQKFKAILNEQSVERRLRYSSHVSSQGTNTPSKRPSSGSTSQTPWCEFVCQYFYQGKVCYHDGTCGDAVNEEVKPGQTT